MPITTWALVLGLEGLIGWLVSPQWCRVGLLLDVAWLIIWSFIMWANSMNNSNG